MAMEEDSLRPAKKARQAETVKAPRDRRLFTPFRALGVITNHVPLALQTRSAKALDKAVVQVATSLGRSWALWDAAGSLRLLFVGPQLPADITSIELQGNSVFSAAGNFVYEHVRGKEVSRLSSIDEDDSYATASTSSASAYNISEIILFGITLCGLAQDGRRLFVWDVKAKELATTIEFEDGFTASRVLHPSTYLNKVVVASKEGALHIINIQTRQLIHAFTPDTFRSSDLSIASTSSAITCIVQSPAIDVLALGLSDGRIIIFDIRTGETLLQFQMSSDSPSHLASISSLSFRTDNEAQTLASADVHGNIALWDLDNGGSLLSVVRRAHERHIGAATFFPGQPILISSGADNAIREWFFETPTSPPRLLKERAGHASPPSVVRYYGSDGKSLLSASKGDRSLRYTSVVRESRSHELSQGSGTGIHSKKAKNLNFKAVSELKLPPVERLAFVGVGTSAGVGGVGNASTVKREWDDVLTAHADGDKIAKSWSVENKRLGKHRFGVQDGKADTGAVKAVCITACGNFGILGFERHDKIVMFNMQSRIKRREFKLPLDTDASSIAALKRQRHVTGIETDALNTVLIVATLSGDLHFFDFHNAKHLHSAALSDGIVSTTLQRDNNLLACICDDLAVRLVDIETKRTVREFVGFRGRIVDMTFSNDSRWLVTTSADSVIRTFDIPTGQLIDAFKTPSMPTSISFSPTGDFLATAHVDSVGVYLWTNRAQFTEVTFRSIDEAEVLKSSAAQIALPALHDESEQGDSSTLPTELTSDDENESDPSHLATNGDSASQAQLDASLATLSLLPRHKWTTLIHLETIAARNKPKEAPKAPEAAPFFLPTLPGTETRFELPISTSSKKGGKKDADANMSSARQGLGDVLQEERKGRKLGYSEMEIDSELVGMLKRGSADDAYEAFFTRLFSLSPSAMDLEIRSLSTEPELILFARALTTRLRSRKDFEAVQAVLSVYLSAHSEALIGAVDSGTPGMQLDEEEVADENGKKEKDELHAALEELLRAQTEETKKVGSMVRSSLGMVAWARGVPVV